MGRVAYNRTPSKLTEQASKMELKQSKPIQRLDDRPIQIKHKYYTYFLLHTVHAKSDFKKHKSSEFRGVLARLDFFRGSAVLACLDFLKVI